MKKTINKYLIILLGIVITTSCDVLDQEPKDLIASSDAIVDARSAESALNGLYHTVQSGDLYGGRFIMSSEMLALNAEAAAFQAYWQELSTGNVPTSNAQLEFYWIAAYNAINAANNIIASVPEVTELSDADQDRMLGTAYFFRGLMFFDLLRQHGEFFDLGSIYGIPLPLEPSNVPKETARSTVQQSFEQINLDLEMAIDFLEDSGDKYYVSKGSAQALMARAALYQKDYATAISMANLVINNSQYELEEDYNAIFNVEDPSSESILELNFINLTDPNVWGVEMYVTPPEVAVRADLMNFFNSRGESERGGLFEANGNLYKCTKYGSAATDDMANTILIRLSEMYMIRAEASAMVAGGSLEDARTDINRLRSRAGLADISSIASEDALITILLNERRAEFAFEGQYWFDLVRLGRMEQVTGRPSYRRVMPIPLREMILTDDVLIQNPEY
ncbi:RagB/SusD family nutrient uptake outer membrane protein [Reichenbachiella ulvae]|uniref:RagB/SusD family nutrient uptake outer membrane protein n=1 Tax=Reichenbachiella ulvae TaxID=2980104 RepID=A0ABT3CP27_9BACT|nr:RagB/SusD family nutrient uptake outer membrane protein [Reichenbachiella ulvae]MCV9385298.1 RagB/SusD family nutrient uptake outer membrane protein [Reichenbachiella ulvae]